jgi:hypothetical protein
MKRIEILTELVASAEGIRTVDALFVNMSTRSINPAEVVSSDRVTADLAETYIGMLKVAVATRDRDEMMQEAIAEAEGAD